MTSDNVNLMSPSILRDRRSLRCLWAGRCGGWMDVLGGGLTPVGVKCILGYLAVYFNVNGLLVMEYFIVNLVGSMQYILIGYVVGSTLVCDSEHILILGICH